MPPFDRPFCASILSSLTQDNERGQLKRFSGNEEHACVCASFVLSKVLFVVFS